MGETDADNIKILLDVNSVIILIRNAPPGAVKSSFLIIFNLSQLSDSVDDNEIEYNNTVKFEMVLGVFQNELTW